MKLNATLGIVITLIVGVGLLGVLIVSRKDEIKKGADIVEIAEKLEMDTDKFIADFESQEVADKVEADRQEGLDRLGGKASTPSVFVNGAYYDRQANPDMVATLTAQIESTPEDQLPLQVDVYEDYNCPACAAFQTYLYELENYFPAEQVVFNKKHLPFLQETSTKYARAAEAAKIQGKFDEYNVELFMLLHPSIDFDFYPFE